MEAAKKHLEEEKNKRKTAGSGQSSRSEAVTTNLANGRSSQRIMNSSGSSFKGAPSTEVRAAAQDEAEKLSLSSSKVAKKKSAPRTLQPIASKSQAQIGKPPSSNRNEVLQSESLKHKQANKAEQGSVIDMGLGPSKVSNPKKR